MIEIKEFLKHVEIFSSLTDKELEYVSHFLEVRNFVKGQIIFKEGDSAKAMYIISHTFIRDTHMHGFLKFHKYNIIFSLFYIIILLVFENIQERISIKSWFMKRSIYFRWFAYYAVGFSILILGNFNLIEFVYFQF